MNIRRLLGLHKSREEKREQLSRCVEKAMLCYEKASIRLRLYNGKDTVGILMVPIDPTDQYEVTAKDGKGSELIGRVLKDWHKKGKYKTFFSQKITDKLMEDREEAWNRYERLRKRLK